MKRFISFVTVALLLAVSAFAQVTTSVYTVEGTTLSGSVSGVITTQFNPATGQTSFPGWNVTINGTHYTPSNSTATYLVYASPAQFDGDMATGEDLTDFVIGMNAVNGPALNIVFKTQPPNPINPDQSTPILSTVNVYDDFPNYGTSLLIGSGQYTKPQLCFADNGTGSSGPTDPGCTTKGQLLNIDTMNQIELDLTFSLIPNVTVISGFVVRHN